MLAGGIAGNNIGLHTAIVATAGCAAASATGGKCANGAATAAFANLYNNFRLLGKAINSARRVVPGFRAAQKVGDRFFFRLNSFVRGLFSSGGLSGNPMFRDALSPFGSAGRFTKAGRALTKHPNIVGAKDAASLTRTFGNQSGINKAAANALKNIMRNGTRTIKNTGAFGRVTDFKLSNGLGARFGTNSNKFITFLGRGL